MKKIFIATFLFLTFFTTANAQKYAVHLTDKNSSPYSLNAPLEFLSQRALDRRAKFGIELTETDLPVNPDYIKQIKNLGASVLFPSRWLNCVLVDVSDHSVVEAIEALDFVEKTVYVAPSKKMASENQKFREEEDLEPPAVTKMIRSGFYGDAYEQIDQLNGVALHERGFQGEGMMIAVLDAGFANVNTLTAFRHLFDEDRLLLAVDIVEPGNNIYDANINSHGTRVLSCMAAYWPDRMVGTAPRASYCLIRTEDGRTEYLIEEYNWVIGAEMADSIGADLLNSSLSYTTFNDPLMNHTYQEMDGKTTIAAIGAQCLIDRGVFAVISAGNSGNSSTWPWIGTPADVDDAMTVGAVDSYGRKAGLSSIGPNAAGEQKPNVMARGENATVVNNDGTIIKGSGTSFSSPILCGMAACLLQACPEKNPRALKELIERNSSLYGKPTHTMGFGIPDFDKAFETMPICCPALRESLIVHPNPTSDQLFIRAEFFITKAACYDLTGRFVFEETVNGYYKNLDLSKISAGVYLLRLHGDDGKKKVVKVVKR